MFPRGIDALAKAKPEEKEVVRLLCTNEERPNLGNNVIQIRNEDQLDKYLEKYKSSYVVLVVKHDSHFGDKVEIDAEYGKFSSIDEINCTDGAGTNSLSVSGMKLQRILINGRNLTLKNTNCLSIVTHPSDTSYIFSNCAIGSLHIRNPKSATSDFLFEKTVIFSLRIGKDFDAREIHFDKRSKFVTKATKRDLDDNLKKVLSENICFLDRASLAILHEWSNKNGNAKMAHIARSAELGIENTVSDGADRIFLTLWGLFSNYGLAPFKPMLWMAGAFILFSSILAITGGTVGIDQSGVGWREALNDNSSVFGRIRIGLVGAAEGIVSPLSVFSVRRLVVPDLASVAIFQVIYNYFCLVMLFLFGFSVRRRFRVG